MELFAAAHGWFPHDPVRQVAFRRRINRLFIDSNAERITFFRQDLTENGHYEEEGYDIILCNGLLGGPLLNSPETLERTVGRLCASLRPGGIFLAADRFHGGWKRLVPEDVLRGTVARCGLYVRALDEGMAGIRQGS